MNKLIKATAIIGSTAVAYVAMAGVALAASGTIPNIGPTGDVSSSFDLGSFFKGASQTIVNVVFALGGLAAIVYLIWAGIKYITAGGDAKKAQEARSAIVNAVIGITVIIGAYTLINIAFGINKTVNTLGTGGGTGITVN